MHVQVLEILNDKEVFRIFEGDDGRAHRVAVAQGEAAVDAK
jgi:hypothetical protein